MTSYAVVTTFSPEGYKLYGKKFIETFHEYWPSSVHLVVYEERKGVTLEASFPTKDRVLYLDLDRDPDRRKFLALPMKDGKNYRYQAKRFCHKVFAMTHAPSAVDWWIWLDADTVTTAPVTEEFLATVCPEDSMCSYLGRTEWHHSECGWLAFNMHEGSRGFIKDFRRVYTSGEIFEHSEWHDSYIFDRVRERYEADGVKFTNLSPNAKGLDAWSASPLASCMTHLKGAAKLESA